MWGLSPMDEDASTGDLGNQPPTIAGIPPAAEASAEVPRPSPEPAKPRRLLHVTLPGCWGGVIFGCLSFTPSLLPRGGIIQGVVFGITAAIGYGLGVLAASIWRAFADRDPRPPRPWAWPAFFIGGGILYAVSFGIGQYWQYEIRGLMGVTDYNIPLVIASPFIAALVFCLILLIGRAIRGLYRWLAKLLNRWIGRRAAHATGWILVAALTYGVLSGVLFNGFIELANSAYSTRDTTTAAGISQPATSLRSGGPGSLVPWNTLGYQGRNFIGKGPSASDIAKFTGHPAMEPIRAYAGLASASDAVARAQLAVTDLERAAGFKRKYLLVVTTTGSGWVDPALVDSFEYLTGGDAATVRDPVLLPAVLDFLPGGQGQGPRIWHRALRRGLRRRAEAAPEPAPKAAGSRREPGHVRRRGGLQRRTQHGQCDQRHSVRGTAQFQRAFRAVRQPPRPWQPGGPARLRPRTDRPVRERCDQGHSAGRPALDGDPGALSDAPVRPDRLVEPEPHLHPARLDQRAARQ